jgi:hypothetical protein
MDDFKYNSEENYIEIIQRLVKCIVILLIIVIIILVFLVKNIKTEISLKDTSRQNVFLMVNKIGTES